VNDGPGAALLRFVATGRELREKFRGLVGPRLGTAAAETLADRLTRIDDVEDLRALTRPGGA
jgi:hypothetical protein